MGQIRVDKDLFRFAERGEGIASSESLLIENQSNSPITYKMKTTDARRFAVRPNLRVVEAGGCVDVTIVYNGRRRRSSRAPHFQLEVACVPESPSFEPTQFWAARKQAAKFGSRRAEDVAASAVKVYKLSFETEFYLESEEQTNVTAGKTWTAGSHPIIRAARNDDNQYYYPPSCAPASEHEPVQVYAKPKSKSHSRTRIPTVQPPSGYRKSSKGSSRHATAPPHSADDHLQSDESEAGSPHEEEPVPAPVHEPSAPCVKTPPKQASVASAPKVHIDADVGAQDAAAVVLVSSRAASAAAGESSSKDKIFVQPMPPNTTVAEAAAAIASRVEAEGGEAEVVILSEPKGASQAAAAAAAAAVPDPPPPPPAVDPTPVPPAPTPVTEEEVREPEPEPPAPTPVPAPVGPAAAAPAAVAQAPSDELSTSVKAAAAALKAEEAKKLEEAKDLAEAREILEKKQIPDDDHIEKALKEEEEKKLEEAAKLKEAVEVLAETTPAIVKAEPEPPKIDEAAVAAAVLVKESDMDDQEKKVEEAKKLLAEQEAKLDEAKDELEDAKKDEVDQKLANARRLLAEAEAEKVKKEAEAKEAEDKIKEAEKTVEDMEKAAKDGEDDKEEEKKDDEGEKKDEKDDDDKKKKADVAAASAAGAKVVSPDEDGSGNSTVSAGNARISQDSHGSNETGTSAGSGRFDTDSDDSDGEDMGKRKRAKRKLKRFGHKIKGGFKRAFGRGSDDEGSSGEEEEDDKDKRKDRGGPSRRKSKDGGEGEASETEENLKKVAQILHASSESTTSETSRDAKDAKEQPAESETDDTDDERREEILGTIRELQELVRKRAPSTSSSEVSSDDTLHNGTIASTPPNERAHPDDDADSDFGTQPSERSRSERSEHDGAGRSVSVTGSVVSERRTRKKRAPTDSTATSPKLSDPAKNYLGDATGHSVSTNTAHRRRRKGGSANATNDDDSDLGGALKSSVFKKNIKTSKIEPIADEGASKEVRFVGAAAHPDAAPAIPAVAMAHQTPAPNLAHDYASTTEEEEEAPVAPPPRRVRLPQPEELTSDEEDVAVRSRRHSRIKSRRKTPRQSPATSPPNEPADTIPVEDVSSGASEQERNKDEELAWLYKRIAETNALIAETNAETKQLKKSGRRLYS